MKISVRIQVSACLTGIPVLVMDEAKADMPLGYFYPTSQTCSIEDVFLHDIFHHAALDQPYTILGEFFTSHIDHLYPWYDEKMPLKDNTDIRNAIEAMHEEGIPVPTRQEVWAFRRRARQTLGKLRPRSWIGPIQQAIGTSFRNRPPVMGESLVLTVDTQAKRVTIQRSARQESLHADGRIQRAV